MDGFLYFIFWLETVDSIPWFVVSWETAGFLGQTLLVNVKHRQRLL